MSINSIDHNEIKNITTHWATDTEERSEKSSKNSKQANARRRIEALRDIKESGLTYEEAVELGLIH
ncbi:hypothetical protein [Thaumasiovibrio sp. DFM-14]|uniref:hypothetical protein n=1 Tax=Thaumasiovibrio sp. DFM-14 TaxID=3384792 RepID=UPI0039A3E418